MVVAGFRMVGAAAGGLTVAVITPPVAAYFGAADQGYAYSAAIAGLLLLILLWGCAVVLSEPPEEKVSPAAGASVMQDLRGVAALVRHNKPLAGVFGAFICSTFALSMMGASILYYFKYVVRDEGGGRIALLLPTLMMVAGVFLWVRVAQRTSKRSAWMMASALSALAYLALLLDPWASAGVALPAIALLGLCNGCFAVMLWSMLPDTVEYGEARTGERHEARVYGFASFAQKASLGLSAFAVGALLDLAGYSANQAQGAAALAMMKANISLFPLLAILAAAAMLWRYPIDAAYHRELRREIAERRAGLAPGKDG